MSKVAYALRAEFEEDFNGATTSLPDGSAFDIAEALTEGSGKIVIDLEPKEIKGDGEKAEKAREEERLATRDRIYLNDALANHPALKRVEVGAAKETAADKGGEG